ncbi:hypothetical protein YTPLAS18_15330 [Nitrospira sp.]|nr:hypothetical protein YTPLAS18_15330 [Nitrospira sp.]
MTALKTSATEQQPKTAVAGKGRGSRLTENRVKAERIRPWIDPEERVTVDFEDASGLNAEVLACSDHVVKLGLETRFPHYRQKFVVPLGHVTVSEDPSRYTRSPQRPLQYGRLWLTIDKKRPPVM